MTPANDSRLRLRPRDQAILGALLTKVRIIALRQVAESWFDGEVANARRRLKKLAIAGLVLRRMVPARSLPPLAAPLVDWRPEAPTPDFGSVAYALRARWRRRAVRLTTVFGATERSGRLLGGVGREQIKYPTQATHDLGTTAVWLRLREQAPAWADAWRGEDLLAHTRRGEKLPDAFIVDASGRVVAVIEFGGAYAAERVEEFHEDCAQRGLAYQLW